MINIHKEVDEIDGMSENKKSEIKMIMAKFHELFEMIILENKNLKNKILLTEENLKMKDITKDEVKVYSKFKKKAD